MGKEFINDYRSTAQQNIENITSLEVQASTSIALQHDNCPDFITGTGTPQSLSKTTQYNIYVITSLVVKSTKHKVIPNEHDTDSTDGTENPQTISKSTQYNKNSFRTMNHLLISVKLMMFIYVPSRLLLTIKNNIEF